MINASRSSMWAAALSLLVMPACEKSTPPPAPSGPTPQKAPGFVPSQTRSPSPSDPALPRSIEKDKRESVQQLAEVLTKYGFRVRDARAAGPRTVLIFSTAHQKDVTDLVKGSVVSAKKFAPNDLLCTEGNCNEVGSKESASIARAIQNTLDRRPPEEARDPLPISSFVTEWKELEDLGYFRVRGVECDITLAIDSNLGLRALGVFDGVRRKVVSGKEVEILKDGEPASTELREALVALETLAVKYAHCPHLDLDSFQGMKKGSFVVNKKNIEILHRFLKDFNDWNIAEFFPRRNADAALGIEFQLNQNGVDICSAVIGVLHTIPREYTGHDSLGEALARRGISSVVLDYAPISFEGLARVEPRPANSKQDEGRGSESSPSPQK